MYDYDACLIYSSTQNDLVDRIAGHLREHAHLKITLYPLSSLSATSSTFPILDQCAACVLFWDADIPTFDQLPVELGAELERRVSTRILRLIDVVLPDHNAEHAPLPPESIIYR